MSQFPKPIPLPDEIPQERDKRRGHLLSAARFGILMRTTIILFEFGAFLFFGSSALLMDALSSSLDIATSLVLVFFIRLAARPPDEDHPFGHGRYEPLAGLQIGLLMVLVGAGMCGQQFFALGEAPKEEPLATFLWIVPFSATLILEGCYQSMIRTAKRQNSPALAADAVHYRIDGLTSLFATVALILVAFFPSWSGVIDHIGAIFIALLMIIIGTFAARSNLNQLMDKVPSDAFFQRVRKSAMKVEGVLETEKLRIQLYGPDAHVDIDVEVDPTLSVDHAHRISQEVRAEIQKEWPQVRDVTVHIEPYYPEDH